MPLSSGENLASILEQETRKKIKVAVSDIDGVLRGKYLHTEKFLSAKEKGFGFCNVVLGWDIADVCYDNSTYTGWHSGYPDALAKVDLATFRRIPWDRNVPFFLADFYEKDAQTPLAICPRQVLKRVIAKAHKMNLFPQIGCEFEWFNFKETPESLSASHFQSPKPLTPGMFGYSILRSSLNDAYFNDLMDQLEGFGIPIEGIHTETGPGVYEAAISRSSPLESADRAVLFKTAVKEIAQKHGIIASFMARWNNKLPGSGGHLHQSLCDASGHNLFASKDTRNAMSPLFRSYLAGLIAYLPDVVAALAPTTNSYKRLVEGYWAPTRMTWGFDNRTCALRVIEGGGSTRVEVRVPGADANPYLSIAASLGAGLLGIERGLDLSQAPIQGSGYADKDATQLAANLLDAALIMERSQAAKEILGPQFVQHFVETRKWEWKRSQMAVTDWELKRYFELI